MRMLIRTPGGGPVASGRVSPNSRSLSSTVAMNNPAASINQGSDDIGDIGGAAGGFASLFSAGSAHRLEDAWLVARPAPCIALSAGSAHRHLVSIVARGP